jgi:hypothetical protein
LGRDAVLLRALGQRLQTDELAVHKAAQRLGWVEGGALGLADLDLKAAFRRGRGRRRFVAAADGERRGYADPDGDDRADADQDSPVPQSAHAR